MSRRPWEAAPLLFMGVSEDVELQAWAARKMTRIYDGTRPPECEPEPEQPTAPKEWAGWTGRLEFPPSDLSPEARDGKVWTWGGGAWGWL
jgi:hypothetical protein